MPKDMNTYIHTYIHTNLKNTKQSSKCNLDMAPVLEILNRKFKIMMINMLRALMKKVDGIKDR